MELKAKLNLEDKNVEPTVCKPVGLIEGQFINLQSLIEKF